MRPINPHKKARRIIKSWGLSSGGRDRSNLASSFGRRGSSRGLSALSLLPFFDIVACVQVWVPGKLLIEETLNRIGRSDVGRTPT